jgi:DNA-binding LytR/AlgR family response regulator
MVKVRIEIDPDLVEEEVVIRCSEINSAIAEIQQKIMDAGSKEQQLVCDDGEKDYYIPMNEILFLETEGGRVRAHTADCMYQVSYRLYELEELLPNYFLRVAKSTILNVHHVRSILKNITGASEVEFDNSKKRVYVSRSYYKALKERLEHRR